MKKTVMAKNEGLWSRMVSITLAANCLHDIPIFLSCFSRRIAIEDTIISKGFVKFSDVAGLEEAKNTLSEAIVLPLQYPHFFTG